MHQASRERPSTAPDTRHDAVVARSRELIEQSRHLSRRARTLASEYRSPEEVASTTVEDALAAMGASGGAAYRLCTDGTLELIGACGLPNAALAIAREIEPAAHHPLREVAELRSARVYAAPELQLRFPYAARQLAVTGVSAVIVAPITWLDAVDGVVAVFYPRGASPGRGEVAHLRAVAARLARHMRHARMYFAERELRAVATAAWRTASLERDRADAARRDEEAANRAKDEFIAVMSHELRTPLSAILGYSELLEQGIAGELTDRQRDLIVRLHDGGQQLLDLIESLLGLSRLRAGREEVAIDDFDLRLVLDQVRTVLLPASDRKRLSLHVDNPDAAIPMCSDQQKLLQILLNLVGNAIKFTETGSIEVNVGEGDEARRRACDPGIVLTVRDTGIGMSPDQLERIFDPFWQGDRRLARRHGGAGLGLSIARGYTQLLGGWIEVESTEGRGTTFIVCLPRTLPAPSTGEG